MAETDGVTMPSDPERGHEPPRYVFGHSERELQRLAKQAASLEAITRQFLLNAGIGLGMRVLDVGTGAGDVAFLASELVGESGAIVGVDRAAAAIAVARQRAETRALRNVSFETGDPSVRAFESPFDGVVGRFVLQFQPEPADMLRRLAARVRPGGIIAFYEIDWTGFRSVPPVAIWDRCGMLATEALRAGGAETQMGTKLASTFADAGLPAPAMRMTTVIGAGDNSRYACTRAADIVLSLLPSIEELGLVAPGEIDPETLADRMIADVTARHSLVIAWSEVAARCRV